MEIVLEKNTELERSLKVVVSAKEFTQKIMEQLSKIQQNAKIDGFRKGKVPIDIVRKRFGQEAKNEVINDLIQTTFQEAMATEKISPVAPPEVNITNAIEGEDLTYRAIFEVFPNVKVLPFSELKIKRDKVSIVDSDVNKIVYKLQEQHKNWEEKNDISITGDKVRISFKGLINGKPFEGGDADDFDFILGSGQMLKDFDEGLVGVAKGDEKKIKVQFPKEYPSKEVANQTAIFNVNVKCVESPVLPEITEEFVKKLGFDSGSIGEMKQEIQKKIEAESEQMIGKKIFRQILDKNLAKADFLLPKILLEKEIENSKAQIRQQWIAQGEKLDEESKKFTKQVNEEAKKRLKTALVVSELVKSSSVSVSQNEIKERIEAFARTYKDPSEVIKWYTENPSQIQALESTILEQKLVDHAIANCVIEDVETTFDDLSNPMQTSKS